MLLCWPLADGSGREPATADHAIEHIPSDGLILEALLAAHLCHFDNVVVTAQSSVPMVFKRRGFRESIALWHNKQAFRKTHPRWRSAAFVSL